MKLDRRIPLVYPLEILLEKGNTLLFCDFLECINPSPRNESIIDRETRVLGRRADERDDSFFDEREQDILLRLHPAMNLIEEEDRLFPCVKILPSFLEDFHDVFFF